MSRFAGTPGKWARWMQVRRRQRLDPAWRARQRDWDAEAGIVKAHESKIAAAGFDDPDHYLRDGSAYCRCLPSGSVQDHNAAFDRIVGRRPL